jgi:hypothetical protein
VEFKAFKFCAGNTDVDAARLAPSQSASLNRPFAKQWQLCVLRTYSDLTQHPVKWAQTCQSLRVAPRAAMGREQTYQKTANKPQICHVVHIFLCETKSSVNGQFQHRWPAGCTDRRVYY